MNKQLVTIGSRGDFPATNDGVLAALQDGQRVLRLLEPNTPMAIDFAQFGGGQLTLIGDGGAQTNINRADPAKPMLSCHGSWLTPFFYGVCFQGNPGDTAPCTDLPFVDRGVLRDVSWHNPSEVGALWATADGGVFSETTIDSCEISQCGKEGWIMPGARNLAFTGKNRFERNSRLNPGQYPSLRWEASFGIRCGMSRLMDANFEDDVPSVGAYLRGLIGMSIGHNRHVLSGVDAQISESTRYASTIYDLTGGTRTPYSITGPGISMLGSDLHLNTIPNGT